MNDADDFAVALDHWTARDWTEYRERVEDGEGSARAIDAIQRRRRRRGQNEQAQESAK
ncbi:hypothetical protein ACSCBZ_45905 [Streptomyces niveiscabiei]|uniref:hypothetical protein n=1 Tax=Streptomyces niveiscabiei TaxID=164115 RepID=UPI000AB47129|nr:hypothetical protein [Streptomyces niveiscabiei]